MKRRRKQLLCLVLALSLMGQFLPVMARADSAGDQLKRLELERFERVVEINPLTTSLCYVNNSVFLDELPEIVGQNSTMGYEYRLDALLAPTRYTADRSSGKRYHYTGEDRFLFL